MSGISNPADTGTRAVTADELKKIEWLTGPTWLKLADNECPEQVSSSFASDEHNEQTAFITIAEDKKPIVQRERFSNFNRLVNTMAYEQRALSRLKLSTKEIGIGEKEIAKATIYSKNI